MKRIIGVMVSVAFSFVMVMDNPVRLAAASNETGEENMVTVVAECDDKDIEIKTNFDFDSASDYTEMVILENIKNDTGIIDSDIEEALNSAGLLDSDIESFTDDEIKTIENANEISIVTKYFEVDESESECVELEPEEIEEYYQEYYQKNYDNEAEGYDDAEYEKESQGFMDKIMKSIGLTPETVYAKTYYDKETDKTEGGKFRNTVVLCDVKSIDGRKSAKFTYTVEWLQTPKYCFDDYFTLDLTGSVIKPGNKSFPLSYTINYKQDTYVYEGGKSRKVLSNINCSQTFNKSNFAYYCVSNQTAIAYHQDLPGVCNGIEVSKPVSFYPTVMYEYRYYDIVMKMSGYVCMTDRSQDQFSINAKYYHLKENKPDLKIESIAVSLPFAVTLTFNQTGSKKYYQELDAGVNVNIDVNYFK